MRKRGLWSTPGGKAWTEGRHARALRLRDGAEVVLFDGAGRTVDCVLEVRRMSKWIYTGAHGMQ